jgi:hypothetical protein
MPNSGIDGMIIRPIFFFVLSRGVDRLIKNLRTVQNSNFCHIVSLHIVVGENRIK